MGGLSGKENLGLVGGGGGGGSGIGIGGGCCAMWLGLGTVALLLCMLCI